MSESVYGQVRTGPLGSSPRTVYVNPSVDLGLKVDVTDIAAVLDLLDGER